MFTTALSNPRRGKEVTAAHRALHRPSGPVQPRCSPFMLGLISRGPPAVLLLPSSPGPAACTVLILPPDQDWGPPALGGAAAIKSKSNSNPAWMQLQFPSIHPICPPAICANLLIHPSPWPPSPSTHANLAPPRRTPFLSRGHSLVAQPLSLLPPTQPQSQPVPFLCCRLAWNSLGLLTDCRKYKLHTSRDRHPVQPRTRGPLAQTAQTAIHTLSYSGHAPTFIPQSPTPQPSTAHNNSTTTSQSRLSSTCRLASPIPPHGLEAAGTGASQRRVHRPFRLGSPSTSPAPRCSLPCLACCETSRHFITHPRPSASQLSISTSRRAVLSVVVPRRCGCGIGRGGFGLLALWLTPTAKAIPGRNIVGLVLNYAHRPSVRR